MEPIGIIEKKSWCLSCNAQISRFDYTSLYKDLSDGNVSPSSAHLDNTYFCNCKTGDIFNNTKDITISPRTAKEKIQEKPLRHDKVLYHFNLLPSKHTQNSAYNDAINVSTNLINKGNQNKTLFSNFTKVTGYKNFLEKSKSKDNKIPWKNFGSLHDISYQQKPTSLDKNFPNNDIRNNSEKCHLYSLSNQDIKINVVPCEQISNKESRQSRVLKTNDKIWELRLENKHVPQDNSSLSGDLIKEKTSIIFDYQNRRSRLNLKYTSSPTSNSFEEPGNQKYKSISTVPESHNVPTKSFNDISVLYTDPLSLGPTDYRNHLSLSPTFSLTDIKSYKKNSTLFVSNQLLQPRHSFSTSHGYHENEIQLNFRRLSEQIRNSCSSENLNANKSETQSRNIRQKSNDTINKTTPVSPNALLETRC